MSIPLHTLQNEFWQAGILPQVGAGIAFGRARQPDGAWRDVLRPTAEADYGNTSKASSFIMLPWCNRIADAKLRFEGREYALVPAPDDGTARHGDVRRRPWRIESADETHILLAFDSTHYDDVNFPWQFSAAAEYRLRGREFLWRLSLTNTDAERFPAGFGHHPYFARTEDVELQIPCDAQFVLENYLAVAPPVPVQPRLDFRQLRRLEGEDYNDLLTRRHDNAPVRMRYPASGIALTMTADPIFRHLLLFTPPGDNSYAVEPMTNASDGFNLYERGIADSGVFVLAPGETASGDVVLRLEDTL